MDIRKFLLCSVNSTKPEILNNNVNTKSENQKIRNELNEVCHTQANPAEDLGNKNSGPKRPMLDKFPLTNYGKFRSS